MPAGDLFFFKDPSDMAEQQLLARLQQHQRAAAAAAAGSGGELVEELVEGREFGWVCGDGLMLRKP